MRAHVHEEAAKRSASFHEMGAATLRRSFTPQPVCMRYKLLSIERIKFTHPMQVRVLDAFAEAAGVLH